MSGDLLPVAEAQTRLLAIREPIGTEIVALSSCLGRYLSHDILALRDQPPAPLSAMDGYAIRFSDLPGPWIVNGEAAAGAAPALTVGAGEAMRIFTGAMLPKGADTVVVQEDVAFTDGRLALIGDGPSARDRRRGDERCGSGRGWYAPAHRDCDDGRRTCAAGTPDRPRPDP